MTEPRRVTIGPLEGDPGPESNGWPHLEADEIPFAPELQAVDLDDQELTLEPPSGSSLRFVPSSSRP